MRVWEIERHDWLKFDDVVSASHVPAALDALSSASSEDEAWAAFGQIDNYVVIQGTPRAAAPATAACAAALLPICTISARPRLIELLEQVSNDEPEIPVELRSAIFREVVKAFGFYVALLQYGDDLECSMCIDLLLYCAKKEADLRLRAEYYLRRLIDDKSRPAQLLQYAAARLEFERKAWRDEPHPSGDVL